MFINLVPLSMILSIESFVLKGMTTITVSPLSFLHPNARLVSSNNFRVSRKTCLVTPNTFGTSAVYPSRFSRSSNSQCNRADTNISPTEELNVTIHRSSLVAPEIETERKSLYLSNIDQCLKTRTAAVLFFSRNQDFPPEKVIKTLEAALRKLLVTYDFVAGRLSFDQQKGRFEVDCNSAGAGFIVAATESALDELGDWVNPNLDYTKLAIRELPGIQPHDQPLLILQITSFKCGGFTMGVAFSHMIFDGVACKFFLENLANVAGNRPMLLPPVNNRRLLSHRSPPQVKFDHPELWKLGGEDKPKEIVFSPSSEILEFNVFRLSASDIISLKEKAKMGDEGNSKMRNVTNFNVAVAHIWRCISLAKKTSNDQDKKFSLQYAINIRTRLRPRLGISYTGNALCVAHCTTTYGELEKGPFSLLVQHVAQAEKRITDDYIRSFIDWHELNKGFVYGDIVITSWRNLGVTDIVYPWGKPKWNAPVMRTDVNNAVYLAPDPEGMDDSEHGKGINIILSLPPKQMDKFQGLFKRFLGKI